MSSLSERCPLSGSAIDGVIPDICHMVCGQLWAEAVELNRTDGPYDSYRGSGYEDYNTDSEYVYEGLQATGVHARSYSIVDMCMHHGVEIGEQSFSFTCPRPANLAVPE